MQEALAYVDPGTGFVLAQGGFFLWVLLLTIFFLPMKFVFRWIKRHFYVVIILLLIAMLAGGVFYFMNKSPHCPKIVVLGIDGMDASLAERLMHEGRLPNFSRLKDQGAYSRLATTNPSESIVAWSSFATGLNPGGHGIFDFVMRRPEDYSLFLAFNEDGGQNNPQLISGLRKGETFWQTLSKHNIPSSIYFCPNTFPPDKLKGEMISGMGTPDLLGMMGKFSFYTSKPQQPEDKQSRGRIMHVDLQGNKMETFLYGPKVFMQGEIQETKIPLVIIRDNVKGTVLLKLQRNTFILKPGEWSGWKTVSFKTGFLKNANGMVRFYLKNINHEFELYVSPVNFDPRDPLVPISYPKDFSGELADKAGLFYTQGMPHDTWALSEGRIDEKVFLEQADIILEEKKNALDYGLKHFRQGVLFFYFETLDPLQHMFWRYVDPKHPLYEANSPYRGTIESYYEKMDAVVGDILQKIDQGTTLIILSDHGFTSFRRSAHLNSWLKENGYLVLKYGKTRGEEFFKDVDWSKTKAYALGFGGIYLNRAGREGQGIVSDSEATQVMQDIKEKMKQWKDPVNGDSVVYDIYFRNEIFKGPYENNGPDLFVGFESGYRASWQTALGAVPYALIEDNKKKWSGDHLVDPYLVPGVLFANKKINLNKPSIAEITPLLQKLTNTAHV